MPSPIRWGDLVPDSFLGEYEYHQSRHRRQTSRPQREQTCLQSGREPLHGKRNEDSENQYHRRRFIERFCQRYQRPHLYGHSLERDYSEVERRRTGSSHRPRTDIRNRDVRLLIVSIVFVGIFSMLTQITFYTITHARIRSNGKNGGGAILIILIALVIAAVGYFFASLMRFAISRKREYMADAGSSEMTKNPLALASALRKISDDPDIEAVKRGDVAQLFIQNPGDQSKSALSGLSGLFATHPPIEKRISILEQF